MSHERLVPPRRRFDRNSLSGFWDAALGRLAIYIEAEERAPPDIDPTEDSPPLSVTPDQTIERDDDK